MWSRSRNVLMLAVLMFAVSGCASKSVQPVVINECEWVRKIIPTHDDVDLISDDLVRQLVRHNDLVELRCP